MCYVLLIVSFTIAWIETWFLDFKVLPKEKRASEREAFVRHFSERTPLLSAESSGHHDGPEQYWSPPQSDDEEENREPGEFKSLPGSRGHSRNASVGSAAYSLGGEEKKFIELARDAWTKGWDIHNKKDGWKHEAGLGPQEGVVHSQHFHGYGRIYRLQGYVHCAPKILYEELVLRVTETPKWSPTVLEMKILQVIDEHTDIIYHVAADAAGGIVSSRDFVSLRYSSNHEGVWASVSVGINHANAPNNKKHVRGENGPSLFAFLPVPNRPNVCFFNSYINTDLKGWIPQYIVDQALGSVLMQYLADVRKRITEVNKNRTKRRR